MSDVDITEVSMSDLPPMGREGKSTHEEFNAVRALEVGKAISFPCRWNHAGRGGSTCNAVMNVGSIARRSNIMLRSICHEGRVYVGRPE